jgi:hypothetical protein
MMIIPNHIGKVTSDMDSELDPNKISSNPNPIKICVQIGTKIVVGIDESVVKKLGIEGDVTILEQQVINDGIFMRVINKKV